MAKNNWNIFLKRFMRDNPSLTLAQASRQASRQYKGKQLGGASARPIVRYFYDEGMDDGIVIVGLSHEEDLIEEMRMAYAIMNDYRLRQVVPIARNDQYWDHIHYLFNIHHTPNVDTMLAIEQVVNNLQPKPREDGAKFRRIVRGLTAGDPALIDNIAYNNELIYDGLNMF